MTKDVIARRLQALEARRRVPSEAADLTDEEIAARLMEDPDAIAGGLSGPLKNKELAALLLHRIPPAPRREHIWIDPLTIAGGK
jgi:hypothetical protein